MMLALTSWPFSITLFLFGVITMSIPEYVWRNGPDFYDWCLLSWFYGGATIVSLICWLIWALL